MIRKSLSDLGRLGPNTHLAIAAVAGLALRMFFVRKFPTVAGDTRIYEELAHNWLTQGVYGLVLDGKLTPVDIRAPGYPAFLAAIHALFGTTRLAVMVAQASMDVLTCGIVAALAARLANRSDRTRAASAGMWLAALCPFTANYTAVPLTEALATFLTASALLLFVAAYGNGGGTSVGERRPSLRFSPWFLGAFVVGLGTLVRPETPLVLTAVALLLCARWYRPADWAKLIRIGLLLTAGFILPLAPWTVRNWHTFGKLQFLAPRHAELPGEFVPDGFNAWTNTWLVRFRDVYLVLWKLEEEPIPIESLPSDAFDSAEERSRVEALLAQYNETTIMTPELDSVFARLARDRAARHPIRTYLWIPLERAGVIWFTPRTELLPYSGDLWPVGEKWEEDPVDFLVTAGLGLLGLLYVGLALAGAWRIRGQPGLSFLITFILIRTAFLTRVEAPEPRYVLVCFPAIMALAAFAFVKPGRVREALQSAATDSESHGAN